MTTATWYSRAGRAILNARVAWGAMTIFAIATSLVFAAPYLRFDAALSRIPLNGLFPSHFFWLFAHAVPSGLALILGPFQLSKSVRSRWPKWHRIGGMLYLYCVVLGSIAALASLFVSTAGFAAQIAFALLVFGWVYSAYRGYRAVRHHRFSDHRIWMIRNYALTFAAVLLRAFLLAGLALRRIEPTIPFDQIYTASVWSSILVSVLIAEWFILARYNRTSG